MNENTQNFYGLGDYNTEQIKIMSQVVELSALGASAIILNRRPDATLSPGQYIKMMRPDLTPSILPDSFAGDTGVELVKNINLEQIIEMGKWGDPFLKHSVKDALERALASANPAPALQEIKKYITGSPAWQI